MSGRPRLMLFAKPPLAGVSKTRLARDLGPAEAERIARLLTVRAVRAARDPRWDAVLYGAPDWALSKSFGNAWPASLPRRGQGGGGLGDRLGRAFAAAPPGLAGVMGMDAPALTTARIAEGFAAARPGQASAMPAEDGGFAFLALWRPPGRLPDVLKDIAWSAPTTLNELEAALGRESIALKRLSPLADIDEGADWIRWHRGERRRAARLSGRYSAR